MKVGGTLKNAQLEVRSSAPADPAPGQIWLNSTTKKIEYYLDAERGIRTVDGTAPVGQATQSTWSSILNRPGDTFFEVNRVRFAHTTTPVESNVSDPRPNPTWSVSVAGGFAYDTAARKFTWDWTNPFVRSSSGVSIEREDINGDFIDRCIIPWSRHYQTFTLQGTTFQYIRTLPALGKSQGKNYPGIGVLFGSSPTTFDLMFTSKGTADSKDEYFSAADSDCNLTIYGATFEFI